MNDSYQLPSFASILESLPYPLLFATLSGAHLYGFPSKDSDYDFRGAHILSKEAIYELFPKNDTISISKSTANLELDLVTHDVLKFFRLMIKNNGYVMEQLYSPIVIFSQPEHEQLKDIAKNLITKNHVYHYLGFARNQWKLFNKEDNKSVKSLLYVFRVLFTGIHLMKTGQIEANILTLNNEFRLRLVDDLVDAKINGNERGIISDHYIKMLDRLYSYYYSLLEKAFEESTLPLGIKTIAPLDDFLISIRKKYA